MTSREAFDKLSKILFNKTKKYKDNWVWYNGRYYSENKEDRDQLDRDINE